MPYVSLCWDSEIKINISKVPFEKYFHMLYLYWFLK